MKISQITLVIILSFAVAFVTGRYVVPQQTVGAATKKNPPLTV